MARRSRLVRTLLLTLIAGGAAASVVAAASPSPSLEPAPDPVIQFWLDEAVTPDVAPAGTQLGVGFMLWDTDRKEIAPIEGLYARLYPASGTAKPATVDTATDWPGHLTATFTVPKGGPGKVEVGFSGRQCTNDGADCKDVDFPFALGGVGPPPEASRAALVDAEVHLQPEDPIAGRPFDLIVQLEPRAAWSAEDLAIPNRLIAIISRARGPEIANFEIHPASSPGSPYTGRVTIPEAGDYTIFVAIPGDNSEDQPIESATVRFKVLAPEAAPADDPVLVPVGEPVPWPWIGGGVLVVVLGGLVIRRVFADL